MLVIDNLDDENNNEDCKIVTIKKSYEEWSHLIDLLDIAVDELENNGHKVLARKLSIESICLSRDAGMDE